MGHCQVKAKYFKIRKERLPLPAGTAAFCGKQNARERKQKHELVVGIIGAMEIEVEALKKDMKVRRTVSKAGMEFCQGVLSGCEAVVVRSGIGR